MKRMIAMLVVLLALPAAAAAQNQPRSGGPMGGRMANLAAVAVENGDSLALSADQIAKLQVLADTLEQQAKPLRDEMAKARESGGGRDAMMPLMEKFRAQRDKELEAVKAILDDAQDAKFDAIVAALRPRRGGNGPRG